MNHTSEAIGTSLRCAVDSGQLTGEGARVRCPECGALSEARTRFCGQCGSGLTSPAFDPAADALSTVLSIDATPEADALSTMLSIDATPEAQDDKPASASPDRIPPGDSQAACAQCSAAMSPEAHFCQICGTQASSATDGSRCPGCQADLPSGARFCMACGLDQTPPEPLCTACNALLSPAARFCMACGTPAAAPAVVDPGLPSSAGDEDVLTCDFHPNLLLFWLKQTLAVSPKRLHGQAFTTLGPVPIGRRTIMVPLRQVAAIEVGTRLRVLRLVLAVLILIGGAVLMSIQGSSLLAALVILVGLGVLATSLTASLDATNTGGLTQSIEVSMLEKGRLTELAETTRGLLTET